MKNIKSMKPKTKKNNTKKNNIKNAKSMNPISQQVLMAQRSFSHRAGKKYDKKSAMLRVVGSENKIVDLQKEITLNFLYILNTIKLYHWKTNVYAQHKATDELYSKLNDNFDKFVEILLGKLGNRIHLENYHSLELTDLNTLEDIQKKILEFKTYLMNLDDNQAMKIMKNTDLYNIRDEILGDLNQFLYLLSFK